MKLTVMDGEALNPGDLSWDSIKAFCDEFSVYPRTEPEKIIERIGNSDMILLNKVSITKEIMDACPSLKYIGVLATGYNVIDIQAARDHGITVTNIPSYSTNAVAQHVFAFILHFANRVALHSDSVHSGDWIKSPNFCSWKAPLTELSGKTLGIFGYGHIGQKVAEIGRAFGMKIIVTVHNKASYRGNEECVEMEELFSRSDFISLHAPLTPETKEIANEKTVSLMKKSAVLINTARGGLVNELAIRNALCAGNIAGYAADVLLSEPMAKDCPLLNAPNCIITPHVAWAPKETRERLMGIAAENIAAFLNGKAINVVS